MAPLKETVKPDGYRRLSGVLDLVRQSLLAVQLDLLLPLPLHEKVLDMDYFRDIYLRQRVLPDVSAKRVTAWQRAFTMFTRVDDAHNATQAAGSLSRIIEKELEREPALVELAQSAWTNSQTRRGKKHHLRWTPYTCKTNIDRQKSGQSEGSYKCGGYSHERGITVDTTR